jgi:hypothetical protein
MTDILIDVAGTAHTTADPERGIAHASVTADGPEPQQVKEHVSRVLVRIRAGLEELQKAAAVQRFAIDQVRISSHRPWNESGEQLPLVHTASVGITAHFADFTALGRWVTSDGLTVHYIQWTLTDQTRVALERQTRQAAVRDAAVRAQDYADALDLGPVQVRSIRDPQAEPAPRMMMAKADMQTASADIDLAPAPIEIGAVIHAGFVVTR